MAIDCPTYNYENIYIDKECQYVDFINNKKDKKTKLDSFNIFEVKYSDIEPHISFEVKKKTLQYKYDECFLEINTELSYLEKSFIDSEYIIQLEDNWDDEGASKYDLQTWYKSLNFVNNYANTLFLDFNKKIIPPKIYHGPSGSIDILFETENYTLLINILKKGIYAEYFGKDKLNNTTKGTITVDKMNKSLIPLAFGF